MTATDAAWASERKSIPRLLTISAERILQSLGGLSAEEIVARPHGLASALWQIGHVAVSDANLAIRAGDPVPVPEGYATLFAYGSSGGGALPGTDEVVRFFRDVHARLLCLAGGDLDKPTTSPSGTQLTIGDSLIFGIYHRGYHHGKIMTLRALLGKPRLLG